MRVYKDTTFCISPNCENKCGRKFTEEISNAAAKVDALISVGFFCGGPETEKEKTDD